jgi:predicted ATP-grasp superfamily ATP-dependent carboligase
MPANPLPPCIVLGLETQIGLGIVRELGRAGVPVIGIAQSQSAIGLRSRHLSRSIVIDEPRSDALIACLVALGEEYGEISLLAVSEVNLNWLMTQQSRLGRVRPILPKPEALLQVLDKQKTLAVARSLGINTPQTTELSSLTHLEALLETLSYPVVLKWKDPAAVMHLLSSNGLPLHKAEYAANAEELRAIGKRYEAIGKWPLIQEYCPGYGLGQFFFMHNGKALRRFQHLRVAEWPPEGGFSSVCDSLPLNEHLELQDQSIALLHAIGWEGVAMVEYRFDPKTGRAVLMEINGRFWGSFPLAVHCQAKFALLAYFVQGLGQNTVLEAPIANIRCRMFSTEVKRLLRIIFSPKKIRDPYFQRAPLSESIRFITDYFKPSVKYYVWDSDDRMPFLYDVLNIFRKRE